MFGARPHKCMLLVCSVLVHLECIQQSNHETRYQPNENFVEMLSRVKTCAVRNEKTCMKTVFGSKNASQTQMHLWPCFSSEKEWLWRHMWLMCDLVDASMCTSLVMCYQSQPHIVTGHLKRQCLFGCKISAFGKHKFFWRDEFRISIWPPPQIEIWLKYNLTQKVAECTLIFRFRAPLDQSESVCHLTALYPASDLPFLWVWSNDKELGIVGASIKRSMTVADESGAR